MNCKGGRLTNPIHCSIILFRIKGIAKKSVFWKMKRLHHRYLIAYGTSSDNHFIVSFRVWVSAMDWYSYWYCMYAICIAMVYSLVNSILAFYACVKVSIKNFAILLRIFEKIYKYRVFHNSCPHYKYWNTCSSLVLHFRTSLMK